MSQQCSRGERSNSSGMLLSPARDKFLPVFLPEVANVPRNVIIETQQNKQVSAFGDPLQEANFRGRTGWERRAACSGLPFGHLAAPGTAFWAQCQARPGDEPLRLQLGKEWEEAPGTSG